VTGRKRRKPAPRPARREPEIEAEGAADGPERPRRPGLFTGALLGGGGSPLPPIGRSLARGMSRPRAGARPRDGRDRRHDVARAVGLGRGVLAACRRRAAAIGTYSTWAPARAAPSAVVPDGLRFGRICTIVTRCERPRLEALGGRPRLARAAPRRAGDPDRPRAYRRAFSLIVAGNLIPGPAVECLPGFVAALVYICSSSGSPSAIREGRP
jgi:hypothetical protein